MTKRKDVDGAVGSKKKEWHSVKFREEYHYWTINNPWDANEIKKHGLQIDGVEVKSHEIAVDSIVQRITNSNPMVLDCGVKITNGRTATTTQNRTARFYFRPDSMKELNDVMLELSKKNLLTSWLVNKLDVSNLKLGSVLNFRYFSPNHVENSLFLESVVSQEFSKTYQTIPLIEQQNLCNNFYQEFAACTKVKRITDDTDCAIRQREIRRRIIRTPQAGYKRRPSQPSAN